MRRTASESKKISSPDVESGNSRVFTVEERAETTKEVAAQEQRNEALLQEVVFILKSKLDGSGIKIHDIEHRIKKVDSIIDKCERKGIQDHNLLVDIVGARVVCLFRSDMSRVAEVLSSNFDVENVDDKLLDQGPLGYQSTHYICMLPGRYKGPRYEKTGGVKFEIQVRTLCMHAWAAVSHHLDYKGDWDVPEELKRALSALGGLFYVADNEFEQFYSARLQSKLEAEQTNVVIEQKELNLDTIIPYLKQHFADRKQPTPSGASKLVKQLKGYGYKSIQDLEHMLNRGEEAFAAYERSNPPASGRFYAEGAVRVTDRIVNRRPDGILSQINEVFHLVKPN
ncbi:hypothetical protein [Tardiphaga sp. 42S5]|uniref:GTP pyrophosphokinase n=1 Tax=Tardiphaga sp. 42S5 TaxID=1404799 RepID=UPI002A5996CF|nr:hypothetical protein [Tardiphaga sp. 42S5]WPO40164.1 hypothetical protein SFY93_21860 [Tardiphaga sp. 42S5]